MDMLTDPGKDGKASTSRFIALSIIGSYLLGWYAVLLTSLLTIPADATAWDAAGPALGAMSGPFLLAASMYGISATKDVLKHRAENGADS